ncbi:IclR family transcriptional regulator [Amycolatopsis pithecellobii]|uniref:Helix-turn-helix domain-containing protein n=1 Tax=Amycolatopsis pithecellobii TaxID=664692 RepID=A0A6N7YQY3_9PSEU|nr:IclR family transcriptional regulator [Amycolatopsis pithecellobii]MTD55427.1 helix-turn-helix domain-containing protein [Amycolatopsis pithecellobii]
MTNRDATSGTYRGRNSTADRTLDILLLYTADKPVWTGSDIAARLGVARSTAYRYLQSLIGTGLIEETEGGFRIGPRIFDLARSARTECGLSEVSLPAMRKLAAQLDGTVLLTRRSGRSVVCVELIEARPAVRLSYDRGLALPINAGAAAEVLLAWADPHEISMLLDSGPLARFTSRTLAAPDTLRARFTQIRNRGVAITRGELDEHILGVSAPIRDVTGAVCAAISVAALAARVRKGELKNLATAVCRAATAITHELERTAKGCPESRDRLIDQTATGF